MLRLNIIVVFEDEMLKKYFLIYSIKSIITVLVYYYRFSSVQYNYSFQFEIEDKTYLRYTFPYISMIT